MAATVTSRRLRAQFNVTPSESSTSSKRTWNFTFAANEITAQLVQTLVTAMITNNAIFDTPPLSIITAYVEETTQEKILPNE